MCWSAMGGAVLCTPSSGDPADAFSVRFLLSRIDEDLSQMPLRSPCNWPMRAWHRAPQPSMWHNPVRNTVRVPNPTFGRCQGLGHGAMLDMHMHSENTVSHPHMPLALGMEIFTRDHDQHACDSGPRHTGLLVVHLGSLAAVFAAPGRQIYVFPRLSGPPIGVRMP